MSSEKILPAAAAILYTSLSDDGTACACTATFEATCSWYTQATSFTVDPGPGAALHISTAPTTRELSRNAVLVRAPNSLFPGHPTGCSSTLPPLVHGALSIAEPPRPAGVAAAPRTLSSLPSWLALARLSQSEDGDRCHRLLGASDESLPLREIGTKDKAVNNYAQTTAEFLRCILMSGEKRHQQATILDGLWRHTAWPPLSTVRDMTGWYWQGLPSPKLITVCEPTQIFFKPQTHKCYWTFTHPTTTGKMPHQRENSLTRRRPKILHNGLPGSHPA